MQKFCNQNHFCIVFYISDEKLTLMGADAEELLQAGYRYALSLTHDPDEAEDLVQDTWIKLQQKGHGQPERAFFLRSLRNLWIDEIRRRNRRGEVVELDEARVVDERSEQEPAVSEDEFAFTGADLESALGRIRPEEREVLYLNAVEQMSARDIAEHTGRSRGTVLSLLSRGKERLRRILNEVTRERE